MLNQTVLSKTWNNKGNIVTWPPKLWSKLEERDQSCYCEFHDDVEHSIDQWIALHQEILSFLKKDFLIEFLLEKGKKTLQERDQGTTPKWGNRGQGPTVARGGRGNKRGRGGRGLGPLQQEQEPPQETSEVNWIIEVITWGLEISRIISSSSKRMRGDLRNPKAISYVSLYHERIYFRGENLKEMVHPCHDALVIALFLANCKVKRILVDTGSTTNITFSEVAKKM